MLMWLQNLLRTPRNGWRQAKISTWLISLSTLSTPVSFANVVGSDTQNFNPTTSGLDFVTVHSSETLEPGYFNLGLFLNYAVNTLPYFDNTPQGRTTYADSLLGADFNLGVGLLPNWDVGLSLPHILYQQVETDSFRGQFGKNGNTEVRVNSKVRLWGTRDYGVALIGSGNINRIKNNPYTGKKSAPIYNLELAADTTIKKVALALNVGHRWRKKGEPIPENAPIEPIGNQIIASAAASYLIETIDTKLIFEVFGSQPAKSESENSNRLSSSAETLIGLKHDFNTSLAGHFGGGTEITHGRSSPDWRAYAGINWSTGPAPTQKPQPVPEKPAAAVAKPDPFAGPVKSVEKIVIYDILFEFDSDRMVVRGAKDTLKKLADYINRKPAFTRLVIEGHTDSVGSDQYNDSLSQRRANKIRSYLIEKLKADPKKIEAHGRGERFPIADNGNYQGRQLNRRVEFTIYRPKE